MKREIQQQPGILWQRAVQVFVDGDGIGKPASGHELLGLLGFEGEVVRLGRKTDPKEKKKRQGQALPQL